MDRASERYKLSFTSLFEEIAEHDLRCYRWELQD
jgi:hypothetical protein